MLLIPLFTKLLTSDRQTKIVEVSNQLKINPDWLSAVIYFETGRTFNPKAKNQIGSVGLIQFTRDKAGVEYKTIGGVKYPLSEIYKMSFNEQMDLVYQYLKPFKGKMNSFLDVYLAVFFPNAMNQSDDYVFQTKGLSASLIAKQNPAFDTNKDGQIKRKEVTDFFRKLYKENFPLIEKKKTLNIMKAFWTKYKYFIIGGLVVAVGGYFLLKKKK
ncbi:hypothetical protein [Flavobacterium sp.]|uniref:hypothetical protein n=1 Tax=Flavobacterium sp. TaxID=239 RepID=UPI0022C55D39|nr:hypothetical protein [Flavobacterium sp.]MCZ8168772.1 hypothetical protein [Flavobacterium sp.]